MAGTCCAVYSLQGLSSQGSPQAPHASAPTAGPAESPQARPEKPEEKHSSQEDRQRLVAIAHKLEAAPLDPTLAQEREWAVSWVVAAPDVHAKICPSLLADLRRPRYKYKSEMGEQLLISSAAFLIERPEQSDGLANQSIAGMEGVLKAYSAIVRAEPRATAKSLDALLQKQHEGKLADAVREIVKDCH